MRGAHGVIRAAIALLSVVVVACGGFGGPDSGPDAGPDSGHDGGRDIGIDAGPTPDAGADGGTASVWTEAPGLPDVCRWELATAPSEPALRLSEGPCDQDAIAGCRELRARELGSLRAFSDRVQWDSPYLLYAITTGGYVHIVVSTLDGQPQVALRYPEAEGIVCRPGSYYLGDGHVVVLTSDLVSPRAERRYYFHGLRRVDGQWTSRLLGSERWSDFSSLGPPLYLWPAEDRLRVSTTNVGRVAELFFDGQPVQAVPVEGTPVLGFQFLSGVRDEDLYISHVVFNSPHVPLASFGSPPVLRPLDLGLAEDEQALGAYVDGDQAAWMSLRGRTGIGTFDEVTLNLGHVAEDGNIHRDRTISSLSEQPSATWRLFQEGDHVLFALADSLEAPYAAARRSDGAVYRCPPAPDDFIYSSALVHAGPEVAVLRSRRPIGQTGRPEELLQVLPYAGWVDRIDR
ncbi:MAG: hypothetical protein ACFCGT_00570 [Sandaracinaceae bacterium]